jgi:glycosyltransferase involved in cell wall biosynthesis
MAFKASPELCVIVLSLGAPKRLVAAVNSLLRQSSPVEVVVVNSGGGNAARLLREAGIDVPVVDESDRLLPGAARNRGIRMTTARYVAFLADDCLAADGWVEARTRAHRGGCQAVASSLMHDRPLSPTAWASHLALFARRLPGTPRNQAALYGVSYARELFDRHGLFLEDTRIGEDTDFNTRIGKTPCWIPEVCTIHRTSRSILRLMHDQFQRGARSGLHLKRQGRSLRFGPVRRIVWQRLLLSLRMSRVAVGWPTRLCALAAWPLIVLAHGAYGLGVLQAGWERGSRENRRLAS